MLTALFDQAEKDKIEKKHQILAPLQQNGFPNKSIQRTVKKHNRRKEQPRQHPEEEPKQHPV